METEMGFFNELENNMDVLLCIIYYALGRHNPAGNRAEPPNPEAPHACRVCRNVPLLCPTPKERTLLAIDQEDISIMLNQAFLR